MHSLFHSFRTTFSICLIPMLILVSHTSGNTASKLWNRFADYHCANDSITNVSLILYYAYQQINFINNILSLSLYSNSLYHSQSHAGWSVESPPYASCWSLFSVERKRQEKLTVDHGASQAASISVYQFHVLLRVEYGRQSG